MSKLTFILEFKDLLARYGIDSDDPWSLELILEFLDEAHSLQQNHSRGDYND